MPLTVDFDGTQWIAHVPFEEREVVKAAGFCWDKEARRWATAQASVVEPLQDFATPRARRALTEESERQAKARAASRAMTTDRQFPVPNDIDPKTGKQRVYMDFQKAGIAYALDRKDVLIADPPGLGKTIEAIGTANALTNLRMILVVCPASLKINWAREWEAWSVHGAKLPVGTITTITQRECINPGRAKGEKARYRVWTEDVFPDHARVLIVNHELLDRHIERLRAVDWSMIIIDEAHYLTNPESKRTLNIFGGSKGRGKKKTKVQALRADRRVMLTGTPMMSRPKELWPIIKAFDPTGLGRNYLDFAYRYCGAYTAAFGLDDSGASNLPELQDYLRSRFMIRRPKTEALKDLPPKRRQIIELPADGLSKEIEAEAFSFQHHLLEFEQMMRAASGVAPPEEHTWSTLAEELEKRYGHLADLDYNARAKMLRSPDAVAFEEISRARKDLALAKLPMVEEHLTNLLSTGEKVICFVYHTEVAEALRRRFQFAAFVTGKVASGKRQAEVDRFQDDPDCTLFIGNINAAGVGYTMTASSIVVCAELCWTPSELTQAEDRAWRNGQKNAVLVQHLVVENSIDARMVEAIIDKQASIDAALDDLDEESLDKDTFVRDRGPDVG